MFGKKKQFRTLYLVVFFGILFFLIHFFIFPFNFFVHATVSVISYPVIFVQEKIVSPLRSYVARRKRQKYFEKLLVGLQKENERLFSENIELHATAQYQKDTAELVQFKKRYDFADAVIAQIVFRQINDDSQFVLLNKGSFQGITKDMVAVYKNNLVGKIVQVYPFYSKLILISNRSCKVAAHCAKTRASGIHAGQNDSECSMLQRVSHLCKVNKGDLVLSSGEGLIFPQGFALGKVASVAPDGLYLSVSVKPQIDVNSLNYCCLIKKGEISV